VELEVASIGKATSVHLLELLSCISAPSEKGFKAAHSYLCFILADLQPSEAAAVGGGSANSTWVVPADQVSSDLYCPVNHKHVSLINHHQQQQQQVPPPSVAHQLLLL
jgi:hypothetical protein